MKFLTAKDMLREATELLSLDAKLAVAQRTINRAATIVRKANKESYRESEAYSEILTLRSEIGRIVDDNTVITSARLRAEERNVEEGR